jgi:hypothetical protein
MASDNHDEAPKRLSSDESLWGNQESRRKRGGPAFGVRMDELPQEEPGATFGRPASPGRPSEAPSPGGPPAPVPAEQPTPGPAELRSRRRLRRVNLLIAAAATALLLAGFLLGAAVTRATVRERQPVAQTTASTPSTSVLVRPAPPPRECLTAMERADAAIAYLVGNIRDQLLSDTIQEFVESRRACQAAMR